jgi:hypothetical protein
MEWFWEQYLRSPVDGYNPSASPKSRIEPIAR